jgi:putative transcriptional regulator
MPMMVTLDSILADRRMTGKELARQIGISETQLSLFRSGKVRGIRFSTLARLCNVLDCKPGDLLDYCSSSDDMADAKVGKP